MIGFVRDEDDPPRFANELGQRGVPPFPLPPGRLAMQAGAGGRGRAEKGGSRAHLEISHARQKSRVLTSSLTEDAKLYDAFGEQHGDVIQCTLVPCSVAVLLVQCLVSALSYITFACTFALF